MAPPPPPPPPLPRDESDVSVEMLYQMGFNEAQVDRVLHECNFDAAVALERLLGGDEAVSSPRPGALPQATPMAVPTPVAVPTPMAAPMAVLAPVTGVRESGGVDGPTSPSLNALVSLFKHEFGLEGAMMGVVDDACTLLDVPKQGGALEKATRCWHAMGSPRLDKEEDDGVSAAVPLPIAVPLSDVPPEQQAAAVARVTVASGGSGGGGPWECTACTFRHETLANMGFLTCEICGAAQPS